MVERLETNLKRDSFGEAGPNKTKYFNYIY